MFSRLYSGFKGSPSPEPEVALEQLRQLLDGTEVEEQLRAGGEAGIGPGPGLSDNYLLRWLRAEEFDVEKAFSRLQYQGKWRLDYTPGGCVYEHEIKEELDREKSFMLDRCDKFGRPVLVTISNRHLRKERDLAQNKRSIVYIMDVGLRLAEKGGGDGRISSVIDMRGVQYEHIDFPVTRQLIDVLTTHYPEILGDAFVYEAPTIFMALWKAVSIFLPEATRSRIHFITESGGWGEYSYLLEVLPEILGGKAKLKSHQEVAASVSYGPRKGITGAVHKAPTDDDPVSDDTEFWDAELERATGAAPVVKPGATV